ncbi:MAG: hypothetical protein WD971_05400 [Pirellulales bacterium]
MNIDDIVLAVIDYLNEHQVPYMIVGSLATNVYCNPRSTEDGDFVVQTNLAQLARDIKQSRTDVRFDPQLSFESVTGTKKIVLHIEGHAFDVEVFELSDDEHDQLRFSRRVQVTTFDRPVWIASLEDMIVTKLRWSQHAGREKDVSDARNLIGVQRDFADWPYVESWCDRHGTRELLDRLRKECGAA